MGTEPRYNKKEDIWGLGCILHELAFGLPLFSSDNALLNRYRSNDLFKLKLSDRSPKGYVNSITRLFMLAALEKDPSCRPSASLLSALFTLRILAELGPRTANYYEPWMDVVMQTWLSVPGGNISLRKRIDLSQPPHSNLSLLMEKYRPLICYCNHLQVYLFI